MTKRERREFDRLMDVFDLQLGILDRVVDASILAATGNLEPEEDEDEDDGLDIMDGEDNYMH